MSDELDALGADGWHPQDVILTCQALRQFAESEDITEARATRAYAILFGLIDTADIPYEHTEFDDFAHLSDISGRALEEWMVNQADKTWGEELISGE